ncbi:MAG: hypothetical protein JJ969_09670 [Rhizobiaceae bacterium]|nr:hypothetical protein [Rhizobiaceae bacterium]
MRDMFAKFAATVALLIALAAPAAPQEKIPAEFTGLSEAQMEEVWEFVFGNALFVLMHEAGHMLISEFELPVLGREEDAVDALSTIIILESDSSVFDNALIDASDSWFLTGAAAGEAGADFAFWDEHSVEEQRAYAIVCMMIGHDAETFGGLDAVEDLPEERRESCVWEYQQTASSWFRLLEPHLRESGVSEVEIVYEEVSQPDLAVYAEAFRDAGMLELAKELAADAFLLEAGIRFQMASCGEPNAFWDPQERLITYCYELGQAHAELLADYLRSEAR